MNKEGLLIVLSGPSGVGKKTIWSPLFGDKKLNLSWSISMTTRDKRPGEVDGKDYFFVTKNEFEKAIKNKELLEHAQYADNFYGTPKKYVEELQKNGKNVLLEIECQGALNVIEWAQKNNRKIVTIFIAPPSIDELKKRLINRHTETEEKIIKRLEQAKWELTTIPKYKYKIVNDQADRATNELKNILLKEIKKNNVN